MSITIKNNNSINPYNTDNFSKNNFTLYSMYSRIYQFVSPIFKFIGSYLYRDPTLQKKLQFETLGNLQQSQILISVEDNHPEDSFEIVEPLSPELLEEMKNTSEVISSSWTRVQQIWNNIQNINPFNSKSWNINTSSEVTIKDHNAQEPSYKNFEVIDPIIVDHKDTKIDSTSVSLEQIKKDLLRMHISVNNSRCLNIQDFSNCLGFTLNEEETDILSSTNPFIRKILNFSHQGAFSYGFIKIFNYVNNLSDHTLMLWQLDKISTINIHSMGGSPGQIEITGEILFKIKSMEVDGIILPGSYSLKFKNSLDKEEITFIKVPQEKESSIENDLEVIDTTEELDDDFTIIESSTPSESDDDFETIEPTNLNNHTDTSFDRAVNYLLNNTNYALKPGIISEYLNALKVNHSNFVYNDRLMYGNVPISTDNIVSSLLDLKNNYPANSEPVIFLPFLVKGWTVDHAVVAVINLSNETIEYFDPKGQSWFTSRTEKQSNKNVFDFLTEIGQKVISPTFSKNKILHNKNNIPQGTLDNINCGAYCLQFIEQRINHSFDPIENGIPGNFVNPIDVRRQLANALIRNTYSTLV